MRSQLASYKQLACCRIWGRTYQEDGPSPSSAFPTTPPATTFQAARRLRWHSTRSMRTTSLSSVVSFCGCGAGRTLFFSEATVEGEVEAIRLEGPASPSHPRNIRVSSSHGSRSLLMPSTMKPQSRQCYRADNAVNSERRGNSHCEAYPQSLRKICPPLGAKG